MEERLQEALQRSALIMDALQIPRVNPGRVKWGNPAWRGAGYFSPHLNEVWADNWGSLMHECAHAQQVSTPAGDASYSYSNRKNDRTSYYWHRYEVEARAVETFEWEGLDPLCPKIRASAALIREAGHDAVTTVDFLLFLSGKSQSWVGFGCQRCQNKPARKLRKQLNELWGR